MNVQGIARLLIGTGITLLLVGLALLALSRLGVGLRLPGDIYIKRGNFTFYFPLVTCIVISIILSLILNFIGRR